MKRSRETVTEISRCKINANNNVANAIPNNKHLEKRQTGNAIRHTIIVYMLFSKS